MAVYTMLCAVAPSALGPTFCEEQSLILTHHFVPTEDAEQRLMMDHVDVEENFHPASGLLSLFRFVEMLFVLAGKKKHRWTTDSGTRLRWQSGGLFPGWHIDSRDNLQSLWWHEAVDSDLPPLAGWKFAAGRHYQSSVLVLQAGSVVHVGSMCTFLFAGGSGERRVPPARAGLILSHEP